MRSCVLERFRHLYRKTVLVRCQPLLQPFAPGFNQRTSFKFVKRSHLQAVLIGTRAQKSFLALQFMPTLNNVRKDHGIQVADMRGSIDIEYRRRNVVGFLDRCLGGN